MVVGVWKVELHFPMAQSLKDKRSILQSLQTKSRNRFNVSIAELGWHDKWRRSLSGAACVNTKTQMVEETFLTMRDLFEESGDVVLLNEKVSFYPLDGME